MAAIDNLRILHRLRGVSSLSLTPTSFRWDEWEAWLPSAEGSRAFLVQSVVVCPRD